jgi:autotransporter-associated beta strand protein
VIGINEGVLAVTADNTLGNTARIIGLYGGTLRVLQTGTITHPINVNQVDRSLNVIEVSAGQNVTFSGLITNQSAGGISFGGPGIAKLTGANTYTGGTVINGGTVLASNLTGSALGPSGVVINGGTLGGEGTVAGTVVAGTGAHTIAPSATRTAGLRTTLTVGGLTTSPQTMLSFRLTAPGPSGGNDLINVTGLNALTFNGGTLEVTENPTGAGSLGWYRVIQYNTSFSGSLTGISAPAVNKITYHLDSTIDPGFISIHRGFLGDANDDGTVTFSDFILLANNFGLADQGWDGGDFDHNGVTNFTDFVTLANNFGQTIGSGAIVVSAEEMAAFHAAAAQFTATAVPEPASLAILGAAAIGFCLRRRR